LSISLHPNIHQKKSYTPIGRTGRDKKLGLINYLCCLHRVMLRKINMKLAEKKKVKEKGKRHRDERRRDERRKWETRKGKGKRWRERTRISETAQDHRTIEPEV